MKTLVIKEAENIDNILKKSIDHIIKLNNTVKVNLSSSDFKEIHKEYLYNKDIELKIGKPYRIGPVNIIFSKRRK